MRLVIDLQAGQCESRFRGIGRYSTSLALAMAREAVKRRHDVRIVLSDQFPDTIPAMRRAFDGIVPQHRITVVALPTGAAEMVPANGWRARAAEQVMEQYIESLQPDVLHVASLFEGWLDDAVTSVHASTSKLPTAVTLYDLIPFMRPEVYLADPGYRAYYQRKLEQLKRADLLLAISSYSRQEAISELKLPATRVVDISAAIDESFVPQQFEPEAAANLKAKYGIKGEFVLYVPGGFDPRKNFEVLIEAWSKLSPRLRKTHQLVIGSKAPEGIREHLAATAKRFGLRPADLILTGYVPDAELMGLYSLCKLYVFPSLHEGFGLPALEAMACGAPVIASNATSIPEVVGRQDALFDPRSAQDMSALMQKALTDVAFLDSLKTHSRTQAAKFSWARSAQVALDAMELKFKRKGRAPAKAALAARSVKQRMAMLMRAVDKAAPSVVPTAQDLAIVASCFAANHRGAGKHQLFVDVSELVNRDAKSGIQRVVRSILLQLLTRPPEGFDVVPVYSAAGDGLRHARAFTARFMGGEQAVASDAPINFSKGDVYVGLDLTAHLFPALNPTLSQMKSAGVKIHFVVYDLTPLLNAKWHSVGMTIAFTGWMDSLTRYADGLLCISDAVATDVKRWLKMHPPKPARTIKVSWFHLGADIASSVPTAGLPESAGAVLAALKAAPSFLMVGTVEPRKGYGQAIDAFDVLWRKGEAVNLVIVGKAGWNVDELVNRLRNHPQLGKRLHWLEGISDEFLEKVYGQSTALLAASQAEGFGLPLIEAAQKGLPILARDLQVFREVAGKHAVYFKGEGATTLARAIRSWIDDHAKGKTPGSGKMPWLTWAQSTAKLLQRVGVANSR
ncbi:glycosyltransferase family 1 protein [soil metagenome]